MHLVCKPFKSRNGKKPGEIRLAHLAKDNSKYYIVKTRLTGLMTKAEADKKAQKDGFHLVEVVNPDLDKGEKQPAKRYTAAQVLEDKPKSYKKAKADMLAFYVSRFTAMVESGKLKHKKRGLGKNTIKAMKVAEKAAEKEKEKEKRRQAREKEKAKKSGKKPGKASSVSSVKSSVKSGSTQKSKASSQNSKQKSKAAKKSTKPTKKSTKPTKKAIQLPTSSHINKVLASSEDLKVVRPGIDKILKLNPDLAVNPRVVIKLIRFFAKRFVDNHPKKAEQFATFGADMHGRPAVQQFISSLPVTLQSIWAKHSMDNGSSTLMHLAQYLEQASAGMNKAVSGVIVSTRRYYLD